MVVVVAVLLAVVALVVVVVSLSPELRANYLFWRGQNRKARKIYEALLERHPEKLNLYRKLGKIYYLENRRDKKALKIFELIIRLKIPFEYRDDIMLDVAKYYIIEGRKDTEAIKLIERAVDKEIKRLEI